MEGKTGRQQPVAYEDHPADTDDRVRCSRYGGVQPAGCGRSIHRYGTEPTESSTVYTSALKFNEPVHLRAKAFKDGAVDLYGAAEFYTLEHAP